MSSLQQNWQNWRKMQNRFCLDEMGVAGSGRAGGRDGPNNVCTYEYMNKEKR
jgi:hypothetical protein